MTPKKYKCDYCGGVTYDDEFGNCKACGGPRSMEGLTGTYREYPTRTVPYLTFQAISTDHCWTTDECLSSDSFFPAIKVIKGSYLEE